MASWAQFAEGNPEMAALGSKILRKYGIAYIGTIRPDGGPRVHPISPAIVDGGIYVGVIPGTPKRRDLDRDPRCVLHTLPGPMDSEVCLTARARRVPVEKVEELIRAAPRHVHITRDVVLYELDIERATCTIFESDDASERPKPTRTSWHPQPV